MSISFNANSTGMDNRGTNLFRQAVDLARDGSLDDADMQALNQTAFLDGTASTEERNFMESLKSTDSDFVQQVQSATSQADFDPQRFNWDVRDRTVVHSASGKDITLVFAAQPKPYKQVSGDIGVARQMLQNLSGNRWSSVANPHNIEQVRNFVSSLNPPLSNADKMRFAQAYLTAYYNHPGMDIAWNGVSLQEGIDAVPMDGDGRKYIDCEAYLETARQVTGLDIAPYSLDADFSGERNHQVGVLREGDHAYLLSNNEVQEMEINGRTDEQLIQSVYPDFEDIVVDQSGPMKVGTESIFVGMPLPNNPDINVTRIIDGSSAEGMRTRPDGTSVHMQIDFNLDNGVFRNIPHPQAGDVFVDDAGNRITMRDGTNGNIQTTDGRSGPVTLTVDPNNGNWSWDG
ncbi:MAG: hypothetical protein ACAI44_30970 [Candidatus Sericytochromatia bacterium]